MAHMARMEGHAPAYQSFNVRSWRLSARPGKCDMPARYLAKHALEWRSGDSV